jgi:hypothetical protein
VFGNQPIHQSAIEHRPLNTANAAMLKRGAVESTVRTAEIVEDGHLSSGRRESVGEVAAEKTGSAGDDYVTQDIEAWAGFLGARDRRPVARQTAILRVHELSEGLPLSQPEATGSISEAAACYQQSRPRVLARAQWDRSHRYNLCGVAAICRFSNFTSA